MSTPINPEDRLRGAFEAEAARVEVAPDALQAIRARIRARRALRIRRFFAMSLGSLATASVATVTAVVVGLGSCTPPDTTTPPPPGGTSNSTAPPTSTTTPPVTTTRPPGGHQPTFAVATVPIYYAGTQNSRLVLYREFRALPSGDGAAEGKTVAAVEKMLAGGALDPDYRTLWPSTARLISATVTGDTVVLNISGAKTNNVGAEAAEMAVQQIVWTATAASGKRSVRLLFDGTAQPSLWGHVDASGTLTRAPAVDVLAPVWLISPQHGDSVGRSFDVHMAGIVFEATARLRIRNSAGTVVLDKTVTLNAGPPSQGEAHIPVTLTPGTYTVEGFYLSAKDGSVQGLDSHRITVT